MRYFVTFFVLFFLSSTALAHADFQAAERLLFSGVVPSTEKGLVSALQSSNTWSCQKITRKEKAVFYKKANFENAEHILATKYQVSAKDFQYKFLYNSKRKKVTAIRQNGKLGPIKTFHSYLYDNSGVRDGVRPTLERFFLLKQRGQSESSLKVSRDGELLIMKKSRTQVSDSSKVRDLITYTDSIYICEVMN